MQLLFGNEGAGRKGGKKSNKPSAGQRHMRADFDPSTEGKGASSMFLPAYQVMHSSIFCRKHFDRILKADAWANYNIFRVSSSSTDNWKHGIQEPEGLRLPRLPTPDSRFQGEDRTTRDSLRPVQEALKPLVTHRGGGAFTHRGDGAENTNTNQARPDSSSPEVSAIMTSQPTPTRKMREENMDARSDGASSRADGRAWEVLTLLALLMQKLIQLYLRY
jgi:hypothetical protein